MCTEHCWMNNTDVLFRTFIRRQSFGLRAVRFGHTVHVAAIRARNLPAGLFVFNIEGSFAVVAFDRDHWTVLRLEPAPDSCSL